MVSRFACRFVLGALLLVAPASFSSAQQKLEPLPDGLRHVPLDAMGFVHVRVADFLRSDIGKQLMEEIQKDREASKGLKKIEQELGISLADIDTVTLLMLSAPTRLQAQPWGVVPRPDPFGGRPPMRKDFDFKDMPFPPKDIPKDFFRDKDFEFRDKKTDGPKDGFFKDKRDLDFKDKEKRDFDRDRKDKVEASRAPDGTHPVLFQDHAHRDLDAREIEEYLAMSGPLVIVTSTKPLDRKKMFGKLMFKNQSPNPYDRYSREPALLFLTDHTVMIGMPWEVARYSEHAARTPGPTATPMRSALGLAGKQHVVVAGGNMPVELRRALMNPFAPDDFQRVFAAMSPLLQTEIGLTLELGKNLDLGMQFHAPNEASAANALQAVKTMKTIAELLIEKSNENGEPGGWKLTLEKNMKQALANAKVELNGNTVRANVKMELDAVLVKRYVKEVVGKIRFQGDRTQSVNNLKNIGLAMHSYHDANKRLPPAGISSINDPTGKPILSWSVAILPYIDQGPLYNQFDLTQPWNHPTNKKLIARMPQIYVVPGTEAPEGMTHYRVLVGPQTMFEPGQRIKMASVTDGTSNTIMAVEAAEATIWTRPDDLPFDPKGPLPKFGTSPEGFNALFGDGTVRFIRANTPPETLRALITRNGGELVQIPD